MKLYPKPVENCKSAKGVHHAIYCIENRIADAQRMGWVALEQAWQLELRRAQATAKRKGFK